jgi:hypothetical protein
MEELFGCSMLVSSFGANIKPSASLLHGEPRAGMSSFVSMTSGISRCRQRPEVDAASEEERRSKP